MVSELKPLDDPGKLRVFISYSRVDEPFADKLFAALDARGFDVFIDKQNLPALEDWERELLGLIREVDTVVFIISPSSLKSRVCQWEVDQVKVLSKRLAPVSLIIGTDLYAHEISDELKRLNFVFFDNPDQFDVAFNTLANALKIDRRWWQEHARLIGLAVRWFEGGRNAHDLLRGEAIGSAAGWAASRPSDAPQLAMIFNDFLDCSRETEEEASRRQSRFIGRAFVKPAEEANERGEHEHALRLAAAGALLAKDLNMTKIIPELWPAVAQAIMGNRTKCVLVGHTAPVVATSFNPVGNRVVTGSDDKTARLWDTESGAEIAVLRAHQGPVTAVSFSPNEKRLLTASEDNTARLWDAEDGKEMAVLAGHDKPVLAASFSPDGRLVVTASRDSTARIWDAVSGAQIAVLIELLASQPT